MTKMKILIDGKEINSDDIVIIWDDFYLPDENGEEIKDAWLELKPTHEGIILDVWRHNGDNSEVTGSYMVDDLIGDFCK